MCLLGVHCHNSDVIRQYCFNEFEGRSSRYWREPYKDGIFSSKHEVQVIENLTDVRFCLKQDEGSLTFSASFAAGLIGVVPSSAGASAIVGISRDLSA